MRGQRTNPGHWRFEGLIDAVSALKKDEVTLGPVVLPDGRALIAVVTNLIPAHQGTLDEVKTEVKDKAQAAKLQKIVAAKAAELASRAQVDGWRSGKSREVDGDHGQDL